MTIAPGLYSGAPAEDRERAVTESSALICIGLSYRTAPLALRERLAIPAETISALLARFGCGRDARPARVSELVILSTCNRLELYAAGGKGAEEILADIVEQCTGVPAAEWRDATYTLSGDAAVRHLFRTAAGLESMLVGEAQILGQVSGALTLAQAQGAAGHTLAALFRGAIRAGRRARSETGINRNAATLSSVAVKLVSTVVHDLPSASVLVVGAGEMAELALAALHHRGVRDICVVNRTREHSERLSERFSARSLPFERLADAIRAADVVLTSTAAPHSVITFDMVSAIMASRPDRPLALIDIAMPRDVEPLVAAIANVACFDLDDLQRHIAQSIQERVQEIPNVEAIVEEEAVTCCAALNQLEVQPLIADIRSHTEAIRKLMLERAQRQFAHLNADDLARIEAFSESLVNRLFHEPMVRLRREARDGQVAGYALALRHLWGLGTGE